MRNRQPKSSVKDIMKSASFFRAGVTGVAAFVALAFVSPDDATAATRKWHKVAQTADDTDVYIKPTTIMSLRNGSSGQFAFKSKVLHGSQKINGVRIKRAFGTDRIDCSANQYATGPTTYFDAQGRTLLRTVDVSPWRPVLRGSTIERIAAYVCAKRTA
jgi:hypothetical protein